MKFRKIALASLISLSLLGGCTNTHDAAIAKAEASVEIQKEKSYQAGIESANKPKILVKIDGEVFCSDNQKSTGNCGVTFYNPDTRSIVPQRDKTWVDGLGVVGNTLVRGLDALTPLMLAKEVTNIVKEVGNSAGGNTTNTDSYNSHTEANQQNKTAGTNLVDEASSLDSSVTQNTSTTTSEVETVGGDKAGGDINNSQQNQNNPTTDSSTNNSDNTSDSSTNVPVVEEKLDDV